MIMNDAEEGRRYDEEASALYEEAKHLLEGSDAQPKALENPEEGEK